MSPQHPEGGDLHRALDLDEVLQRLRRRALADSAARWGLWGLAAWAALACLVLAWSKVSPMASPMAVATLAGAVAIGTVSALWAWRRPTLLEVARIADARLGLSERLASALYFAGAPGEMPARLRSDAAAHAASRQLGRAFPLRRHRRPACTALVAGLAAVALLLTPNPQAAALARRAEDQAVLAKARQAVALARHELERYSTKQAQAAASALGEALEGLQKARSPLQGLVALSALQAQLQALEPSTAQDQAEAASAAGQALAGAPLTASLAKDLADGRYAASAADLRALARQLSKLSASQREALAQALQTAARAAGGRSPGASQPASPGVGSLPAALSQAGSDLAAGGTAAAALELGAAANGAAAAGDAASAQQELAAVLAALQNAEGQLAGAAQADSGGAGPAPSSNNGAQAQGATGGGTGSGYSSAVGPRRGAGAGAGSGALASPGGSGGTGAGVAGAGGSGGASGRGSASGTPSAQVFVGGQPGYGLEVTGHELGEGQKVPTTGYRAVLPAFARTALEGLGTQVLDPADESLVRSYFSSLAAGP